jgi:phospholipid/cholesterol/gamma-HCH transport system substrate-binding protein
MRSHAPKNFALIGGVALVVIFAGAYLAWTKRIPLIHGYRVTGVFQSSNQIVKGSPVREAGVDVGKVVGLKRGPGTTAEVTLEIKHNGLPIHKDATLKIRPRLFLEGGFYMDVHAGSPSSPILDSGGTIPLSQTTIPVQLHQILSSLNHTTRADLKVVLKELSIALNGGGAEALGKASGPIEGAMKNLAILAEAARGTQRHDVSHVVNGFARVNTALASKDAELADLVTNLNRTSGAFASQSSALSATIRELDGTLQEAPAALRAMDASLPTLGRFASALRPSLPPLPSTLRATSGVLTQLNGLVSKSELQRLIPNLRPTVQRLPELERRLVSSLPQMKPVADCIRTHVVPVLNAKLDDGKLSSGYKIWQEIGHTFVGLSSASSDFDANGFWVRLNPSVGGSSLSLGNVPGLGDLLSAGGGAIQGISPHWLGNDAQLPFRPDVPCASNALPNLQARTNAPLTASTRVNRKVLQPKLPKTLAGLRKLLSATHVEKILGKAGTRP